MTLQSGTRLGAYEIVSLIGAGGMGEVYRARDTRLGRDVAIKVIPVAFSADADRVLRFEREARAAAAVNHPNILAVHDVGTIDGTPFIVSELLEGETLRDRLNSGPLPAHKAIDCAIQIAHGLAAAHEKSIVHRDLKPENVFLTNDGLVKILDFGLAKLAEQAGPVMTSTNVPTSPIPNQTQPGMVLGTIGYMAPEQVRGLTTDARADLFALGAILYEMLTGRKAFHGETAADTMFAIAKEDPPDVSMSRADLSPALDRIVRHCLEKSAAERFQSARDVAFALGALSDSGVAAARRETASTTASPRTRFTQRALAIAAALVVVGGSAFVAGRALSRSEPRLPRWEGQLLGGSTVSLGPRISPDGQTLAFEAFVDGLTQVAVMKPQSGDWTVLTHDRSRGMVQHLSWSHDGSRIFFDRFFELPGGIFSVSSVGGEPRLVIESAMWPYALPDGSLLVTKINDGGARRLYRFFPETQRLQPLNAMPYRIDSPPLRPLPGGREVVFLGTPSNAPATPAALYILDLSSDQVRRIAPELSFSPAVVFPVASTPDGASILFDWPDGSLHRIVAAAADGSPGLTTVTTLTRKPFNIDVDHQGNIYLDQVDRPSEIIKFFPRAGKLDRFPLSPGYDFTALNTGVPLPDGRFVLPMPAGGVTRLAVAVPGKDPAPFIQSEEETSAPIALVGREHLAFAIGKSGSRIIALASIADGRIVRRLPTLQGDAIRALAGAPDGKSLFYVLNGEVWMMSLEGSAARKLRAGDGVAIDPSGTAAVIKVTEQNNVRFIRFTLPNGPEEPIQIRSDVRLAPTPLAPTAIAADGRLAIRVALKDSWFWPAAILDPRTGRVTLIPNAPEADMRLPAWTEGGELITIAMGMRSSLWRLKPIGAP